MDALRLLTRSTSLQKKPASSRPRQNGPLPSAGAPSHPQFLAEAGTADAAQPHSRGVKRKRSAKTSSTKSQNLADTSVTLNQSAVAKGDQNAPGKEIKVPGLDRDMDVGNDEQTMALEERKKILHTHKLKIHILGLTHRISKKRKDKVKSRKAEKLVQLFPQPVVSFQELRRSHVSKVLLQNLRGEGYKIPTEVQMAALSLSCGRDPGLPDGPEGQKRLVHVLTIAPTGSGKTLAYLIPIISDLLAIRNNSHADEGEHGRQTERYVRAIVVAPTHELVDQIVNEARKLVKGTGLTASGMQKNMHVAQPNTEHHDQDLIKSDILVSTPLQLANSLGPRTNHSEGILSGIVHLVLDEADVLLDPLFRDQTMLIWDECTAPDLRMSFWSATMGASIEDLTQDQIRKRQEDTGKGQTADQLLIRLIVGLKDSAVPNVNHHLTYAATEQGKLLAVRQMLHPSSATSASDPIVRPPFLMFTQTIPRAVALHSELIYDIPPEAGGASRIAVLHSDLSISARSDVMARFRKGEIWVLITTDLLSRGVDFRGVNGVINYDIPTSSASYVHRAGRTGRAGREGGVCVTLYTKEDIPYVKNVANVIAGAEKLRGRTPGGEGSAMPQWLLDSLPDLSKQVKKELKRRGVEVRRSGGDGESSARISTKSGYERKLENRKKGAIRARQARKEAEGNHDSREGDGVVPEDAEFGGFDD